MNMSKKLFYGVFFIWFFSTEFFSHPTILADVPHVPPFKVKAKAAVLINAHSAQIIFKQNSDKKLPPASLAKIMTLYIVYDAIDSGLVARTQQVMISKKAWKIGGSKMFLQVGSRVPLIELIKGVAVVSGNDACVALAEEIAGLEEVFVDKMNKKASILGMSNTRFKNCHGLPTDGQYTTAHDMAILSYHYLKDHPDALKIHSMKALSFNNIKQQNRNGLLWLDEGVDGLKTGWFSKAGYHLIATAKRNDDRFIAVIMGAKSESARENEALKLLNYGFKNFKTIKIFSPDETLANVSVWKGDRGSVSLCAKQPPFITVARDRSDSVNIEKIVPERISAPIRQGQQIGFLKVTVNGKPVKRIPLVALSSVGKAGFIKRSIHWIILFFIIPPYWGFAFIASFIVLLILSAVLKKKKNKRTHAQY